MLPQAVKRTDFMMEAVETKGKAIGPMGTQGSWLATIPKLPWFFQPAGLPRF